MPSDTVVEVSFVFRGKDASVNSEAFLEHMDTMIGMFQVIEGIRHFNGNVTCIQYDYEQKLILFDGDMRAD